MRVSADINLYIMIRKEGVIYLLVYVYDLLLVLKSIRFLEIVKNLFEAEFDMKMLRV